MSDGGKGSRPRPYSVNKETFDLNWERIFNNEYQDILSTEECVDNAIDKLDGVEDGSKKDS